MKKICIYALIVISITGCLLFDAGNSASKKIVGNIYVIDSDEPNDSGFYAIFLQKSGYERHLMKSDERISYLKANDSIILIKTVPNPKIAYYAIYHYRGDSIVSIHNLSDSEFIQYEQAINPKYFFIPNKKNIK